MTLFLLLSLSLHAQQPAPPFQPSASELAALKAKLASAVSSTNPDVAIYAKAADYNLRHPDEFLTRAYYDNALKLLDIGNARAKDSAQSWTKQKGRVARAYRSKVDGSIQPYTVIIPDTYTGQPMRLDVVLHGRNARLNEVSFLADAEFGKPLTIQPDRIELHVYGRTNNAYRWAGEADVFEALDAVKANYKIDDQRIVLRGFSMGGAGTWHIGLHYPTMWAATEAGAGFSETRRYAKAENAPYHEQRAWPIYDSYLYARNALLVPTVGYGSIDDPQLQASTNVKEQLANENIQPTDLRALFLIGPAIGHKFSPDSKKISEQFIQAALAEPRTEPKHIRFLTYTTRYNNAAWITIDGLEQHYSRAEVDAVKEADTIRISTKNVTHLKLAQPSKLTIDGQQITTPTAAIAKVNGKWQPDTTKGLRKRHGLQGPIDDAFLDSFLCVKPSTPNQRLDTFKANWDKFLRGDIRIKDAGAVTKDDIRQHNLILFGDASTNKFFSKIAGKLPFRWTPKQIQIAGRTFDGEGQTLVAIYPNPLNPDRYIVLNSGHTFGEKEFKGTNALLYPRLGDWAVFNKNGELTAAGYFDESWK
ncbi:MAG: prolyl oligopeptidase family serine peptidase [Acidobacteria bacterium]|nr:prolyl oligopeptidase family serine peptidase [Acidobacteriota bacterium]